MNAVSKFRGEEDNFQIVNGRIIAPGSRSLGVWFPYAAATVARDVDTAELAVVARAGPEREVRQLRTSC